MADPSWLSKLQTSKVSILQPTKQVPINEIDQREIASS